MDKVSKGGKSSGRVNLLLQHDIRDGKMPYSDIARGDTGDADNTDTDREDAIFLVHDDREEMISLVHAVTVIPDGYLCIFWTFFLLIVYILLIYLFTTGYLVIGTFIIFCSMCLALGCLVRRLCGQRRDLYSQL